MGAHLSTHGQHLKLHDELDTPLHKAIKTGELSEVKKGIRLDSCMKRNAAGLCPTHLALALEDKRIIQELWESGIQLPTLGGDGETDFLQWLLPYRNKLDFLSAFVPRDPNKKYLDNQGKPIIQKIIMKLCLPNNANGSCKNYTTLLENLISVGLNVNEIFENPWEPLQTCSALGLAVIHKNISVMDMLLHLGASVEISANANVFHLAASDCTVFLNLLGKVDNWESLMFTKNYRATSPLQILIKKSHSRAIIEVLDRCRNSEEYQASIKLQCRELMSRHEFAPLECLIPFLSEIGTCSICGEEETDLHFMYNCGHEFCSSCLSHWTSMHITEGSKLLCCPSSKCGKEIQFSQVAQFVRDNVLLVKYSDGLAEVTLSKTPYFAWCPQCPSGGFFTKNCTHVNCDGCKVKFCADCGKAGTRRKYPHVDNICVNGFLMFDEWRIQNPTKKCPNCNAWIYKDGGCDHMHCSQCLFRYNWSSVSVSPFSAEPTRLVSLI